MTPTDQQLVEKALKALGWTRVQGAKHWWWENERGAMMGDFNESPHILTSRDACWKLWEKDAPDEYWDIVYEIVNDGRTPAIHGNSPGWRRVAKATCPQRIRALLRWKGVE